jgi:hypothetical protein
MPGVTLQLVETKYYLFYTDMPPASVAVFIAYLDSMYEQLSKAFGIPAGKNIFCGKCVVVAFNTQESFLQFEKVVYNNVPNEGTAGLCHSSSSGEVVISVHKLSNPFSFANVLVHETSHGVVHRWLSSVRVPSWINEGIADWVAAAVVKGSRDVTNKQSLALERVRQTASLGGRYFDETMNIEFMYYGIASNMVEFLLRVDANKYRQFLTNIKEGYTTEESLQKSYGVTMQQFVQQYGAAIGVPQLQP